MDYTLTERMDKGIQSWRHPSWWNVLITAPWSLMAVFCVYEAMVDSAVAKREKTVIGIIVGHEVANHNQYRYRFVANGTSYIGLGHPPNELTKVGDQIVVYYDPNNPAKNALTDFVDSKVEVLGPAPLCLFGVGAVAFFI